jgi:hypothetical protein
MSRPHPKSSSYSRSASNTVRRGLAALAPLAFIGCQLLNDKPAEAPPPPRPPLEAGPLPPEETPPPEEPAPPAEAAPPKPVEPGITPTGAPTRGTLPKAVIDERLESAQPEIRACYERGLKAKPDLHGNLSINFVVAPDGKVAHADAGDDALGDAATVDCILGAIRKLQFPEPKGGRVFINYPLQLSPSKP